MPLCRRDRAVAAIEMLAAVLLVILSRARAHGRAP